MKRELMIACALLLQACTNGFEKYYQGAPDARTLLIYDPSYEPPGGNIPIYSTSDMEGDKQKLLSLGFVPVGQSSFYGPDNRVNANQLRAQAQKIGAHAVLFHSSYRDTVTGAVPFSVPNNSTSYSSGTATAYGPGGTVTAYGNSVTNTYGTTTTMVPVSHSRSNFQAIYFIKGRYHIGIFVAPLSDDERQQLQTNLAMKIKTVVQDSQAFLANVLPGDYLTAINDDPISSLETWKAALQKYEGQDVTIHLLRDGKEMTKVLHDNVLPIASSNAAK